MLGSDGARRVNWKTRGEEKEGKEEKEVWGRDEEERDERGRTERKRGIDGKC